MNKLSIKRFSNFFTYSIICIAVFFVSMIMFVNFHVLSYFFFAMCYLSPVILFVWYGNSSWKDFYLPTKMRSVIADLLLVIVFLAVLDFTISLFSYDGSVSDSFLPLFYVLFAVGFGWYIISYIYGLFKSRKAIRTN